MKSLNPRTIGWTIVLGFGILPPLLQAAIADVAWPLYLAERILGGARQGVDFFEVNPPLFLWLAIPPVLLHALTGIGSWQANVVWVVALAGGSVFVTRRLLSRFMASPHREWLALAVGFCVLLLPGEDFGEREHLALIATIPWVALCAARLEGATIPSGLAIAVGLTAGLGFALKPYFLPAWLALEVMVVRGVGKNALRRPELLTLIGTGATYAVAVALFLPEYVSMAARLAGLYGKYIQNPYWVVLGLAGPGLLLVVAVIPSLRAQGAAPDPLRGVCSAACVGFLAGAVLQHKGFSYHFLPAWGFGFLMLARASQTLPRVMTWQPSGLIVRAGLVLGLALPAWQVVEAARWHAAGQDSSTRPGYGMLLPLLRDLAAGGPILVLSSNPAIAWPLVVDAGGTWPLRSMSLWQLPALYDEELTPDFPRIIATRPPAARVGLERRFNEDVLEDIQRHPPEVIVVLAVDSTVSASATHRRIDTYGYFDADARFASVFARYREAARPGPFIVMTRRRD